MAYQISEQGSHGDGVCASELQMYSDSLSYLNSIMSTANRNYATPFSQFDDTQEFWFIHSRPLLIYISTGVLSDPSGLNEDVTLSNEDGQYYNSYDLDTVPWLNYGDLYKVVGCSVCMEDGEM